jgi:putative oxidoreductase
MNATATGSNKRLLSDDVGKLILRVAVGGMMLFHGIGKLQHGVGDIVSMLQAKGLPGFLAYGTYVGEVIGPILVLAGFFTRPAAAIVAFNMIVAIALAHPGDVFRLTEHGAWAIELQMFYLLGALAIVFTGAGKYSISRGRGIWN